MQYAFQPFPGVNKRVNTSLSAERRQIRSSEHLKIALGNNSLQQKKG